MKKFSQSKYNNRISGGVCRMFGIAAVAIATFFSVEISAETVTQKQAMTMAREFFNQVYNDQSAPVKMVYNGKRLTTDRLFTPFYVYNQPRGGFVIISAENKTFPILAYSLKENFDPDKMDESEKNWLESYARDIELIRYDSRVPEEAVEAWNDYPAFVKKTLMAPYESFDSNFSVDEAWTNLENILASEDTSRDGEYSMFYTPEQWKDLIDVELRSNGGVAVGYVNGHQDLTPAVVYGKKGDYYRIRFDRENQWYARLMPAEFLGERMIAVMDKVTYTAPAEPEEPAFEFYDSYINDHLRDFQPSTASIEERRMELAEDKPVVKNIAGGNFDVLLPENVKLAMLYNLNGSHLGRHTYGGTSNVAHISLEAQPRGFYFVLLFGESGKPYGIKLHR
ncbi:MAG: Spi family protease inhibitor [Muribaculaceae bacterium]|nr:Spi family protease inhibitor [Muribaculaceae bacterium]